MTDKFLKVNKDLFGIGLAPIEILIISQVLEYQTKNMDCFESNEKFATDFGMSQSTVSRAITSLKNKGYLKSVEERTRAGTTRYLSINIDKIDEKVKEVSTKQNADSIEDSTCHFAQSALSNLTNSTKQNDLVKDNIKNNNIKEKENLNHPKGKVEATKEVMKDSTDSNGKFKF